MMDIGHALKYIVDHYAELSAIGSTLVLIGSKVHRMWPDLPKNSPRLEALQELGEAIWPDVENAMKAIGKLVFGKKPPVPPLPLLLVMMLALTGCPGLPPVDNCSPGSWRCSAKGEPQLCSPSTRWTSSNRPCAEVSSVCCETMSPYGRRVAACVPLALCIEAQLTTTETP